MHLSMLMTGVDMPIDHSCAPGVGPFCREESRRLLCLATVARELGFDIIADAVTLTGQAPYPLSPVRSDMDEG